MTENSWLKSRAKAATGISSSSTLENKHGHYLRRNVMHKETIPECIVVTVICSPKLEIHQV